MKYAHGFVHFCFAAVISSYGKPRVIIMPTLLSLVALQISCWLDAIMTTGSVTSDSKVGIMTTPLLSMLPWTFPGAPGKLDSPATPIFQPLNPTLSGVGVTKPIYSVPFISYFFRSTKTHISNWMSCLCSARVTAAQLWWHLNVLQIYNRDFCKIENSVYREINKWSFSNPHPLFTSLAFAFIWLIQWKWSNPEGYE